MQGGVGLIQHRHGQRDGVVLALQLLELLAALLQLGVDITGAAQRPQLPRQGVQLGAGALLELGDPGKLLRQRFLRNGGPGQRRVVGVGHAFWQLLLQQVAAHGGIPRRLPGSGQGGALLPQVQQRHLRAAEIGGGGSVGLQG